jgi:predicted alpha/beta superfamily hydrolase
MIIKTEKYCPALARDIPLHIYVPDGYDQSEERYPVMYMLDGQNLFYDQDATYGKSWGLKDFLDGYDKPFIVVGMECDHNGNNRLSEYSPFTFNLPQHGPVIGKADLLLEWIADDLKPWVDETWRTWAFREATGIAGSSMGGLFSYYALLKRNDIFSKAACLSPSFTLCSKKLREMDYASLSADTRLYLSMGAREQRRSPGKVKGWLYSFAKPVQDAGGAVMVQVIPGGRHNEASWQRENKTWFDFLWKQ